MSCQHLILALLFGVLSQTHAQWRVTSQSKPLPLGHGAWYVEKQIAGRETMELKLVFFDSSQCTLHVASQPSKGATSSLADAARSAGALAGCNGGFFTKEFTPLGLMISSGKRTGVFEKGSLLTGVLLVKKGRPLLLWRDEFTDSASISELLQAGPRLVSNGAAIKGLQGGRPRARTFVMTDSAGHWALGLCMYASLADTAEVLCAKKIITEFVVDRALNLDGGSSSGLWMRDASGKEHYEAELATVRNFLTVVPRK